MKRSKRKNNEGVALILTLLFVVLLTVLVVEFAYEAQVEASYALNSGNEYQARLAARSAVYSGIATLETDRLQNQLADTGGGAPPSDSRLSAWAQPGTFEPLNDAVMRTTITDEFGKINLNALLYDNGGTQEERLHIREALIYFFQNRDESVDAEAIVDSLRDWMDEDDDEDGNGAETDFYQSAENPYPCKNGPMDSIDELLLIKGISSDLYFGKQNVEPVQLPLSEYLTVHGDWLGRINPNTVYVDFDSGISEVLEAMREGWMVDTDVGKMAEDVDVEGILIVVADVEASEPFASVSDLSQYVTLANVANTSANTPSGTSTRRPSRNQNQVSQAEQQNQQDDALRKMFTVYSHIFRIQGDALLDDIIVRNEAYVLRVPEDVTLLELPGGGVSSSGDPSVDSVLAIVGQQQIEEFYRILEWKVIQ
jgi:type II secretory pathway component PulK